MRVALIGGGVIGGGWAGRLVENGVDVTVYDPAPQAEERVRETLENAERAWARLTQAPRIRGSVAFVASLAEAVSDADVVQESVSEDEALKRGLLADIDAERPPGRARLLLDFGPAADPPAGGHGGGPSDSWSDIRSTPCTSCRWSKSSQASRRRRAPSPAPSASTSRSE